MGVGHSHDDPIVWTGVGPHEIGGGASACSVIVEESGVLFRGVEVFRKGDFDWMTEAGDFQAEVFCREGERQEEEWDKARHGFKMS